MAERLRVLLQRARTVKQSTSLEPPLPVSELVTNTDHILGSVVGDKEVHMNAIETAARNVFYSTLASCPIGDPSFVDIWNLLDILQYCGDRDLCPAQLVLLLIEELFDSQPISGCRIVFTYLESRREAIIANPSTNKDLVILRFSNELLRRLSRAEDPVFCGRVYIFMFQSFPLGDKSSVNLRGNFHVENVTTFEDYLKSTGSGEEGTEMETDIPEDVTNTRGPEVTVVQPDEPEHASPTMDIDSLYPVFWSLQHCFSNPPRLFEEKNFREFQKGLEATLAKFKEVPKVIQSGESERKSGAKAGAADDDDDVASTFNPKYLTSRDLFKLELSDLAFQRHILVQALILIDFLLTLTEKAKKQPYYQNAQRAMLYAFTLRQEDTEWALGIKNSIANYLQDGPDGNYYYRMVDTVLSRDKNWVRWKMDNCYPITRDRIPTKEYLGAMSGTETELRKKDVKIPGPNQSFKFLSESEEGKGVAKLKQAKRCAAPSIDSYAKKIQMGELDLEMVSSEEEKRQLEERKTSNTWRGLRMASKHRLSSLDRLEQGKGLEKLLQPVTSMEVAGEDTGPTAPEGRDSVPQERHQSVEEQRPDQRSQVTANDAAD
ncbi:uncharacterized protein EI97DRAFT_455084 [Westerdykella ornata]|uniref:Nuclear matrix protein n=1 Tax=Westerdykella ornata TaxID=318751 RepID=A0A6A6JU78_WESOR|nr:uncharacterized protein EI97DRAFT_455084 [Westerdykella ornata]KAF2280161.1 hypothetical protein EI97DRAFT_455084 [Westerdykella ornata]